VALLFMDSFNHYANMIDKYGNSGIAEHAMPTIGSGGRTGGNCLVFNGGCALKRSITTSDTVIVGFAWKCIWIGSVNPCMILEFLNGASLLMELKFTNSRNFGLYRNGTLLGSLSADPFSDNIWYYLEVKILFDGSVGTAELRVNGNPWISLAGQNTGVSQCNQIMFGSGGSSDDSQRAGDLYICNDSGTVNNDFLGDSRVEVLLPSGAGAETQWDPLAGANWENVADVSPDSDTTYNKSNTVGQVDTYAMSNLVSATGVIYGVQKMNYVRKDNAGSRSVAPVLRIGGTDHVGASTSIGDSYAYTREIEEVSPATLSAFTIAEVNAMEMGVQVTA